MVLPYSPSAFFSALLFPFSMFAPDFSADDGEETLLSALDDPPSHESASTILSAKNDAIPSR